jgi:hypothetical protein
MLAYLLYGYLLCIQGLSQYRARAVAVLSNVEVFGDTLGQDNERQFPRLLFCVNLKVMPNDGDGEARSIL